MSTNDTARPKLRDVFHQLLFALACFDMTFIVCGGVNYTFRAFKVVGQDGFIKLRSCESCNGSFFTCGEASRSMDDIWLPSRFVKQGTIEAREALEHRLLRPLNTNLRSDATSEVIWRLPWPQRSPKWLLKATCT